MQEGFLLAKGQLANIGMDAICTCNKIEPPAQTILEYHLNPCFVLNER